MLHIHLAHVAGGAHTKVPGHIHVMFCSRSSNRTSCTSSMCTIATAVVSVAPHPNAGSSRIESVIGASQPHSDDEIDDASPIVQILLVTCSPALWWVTYCKDDSKLSQPISATVLLLASH
jgi:hypothetical protein